MTFKIEDESCILKSRTYCHVAEQKFIDGLCDLVVTMLILVGSFWYFINTMYRSGFSVGFGDLPHFYHRDYNCDCVLQCVCFWA